MATKDVEQHRELQREPEERGHVAPDAIQVDREFIPANARHRVWPYRPIRVYQVVRRVEPVDSRAQSQPKSQRGSGSVGGWSTRVWKGVGREKTIEYSLRLLHFAVVSWCIVGAETGSDDVIQLVQPGLAFLGLEYQELDLRLEAQGAIEFFL
jgi:hypothetical protein